MKFEREIPIGLDARRKKWQGGAIKAPPPMGLGLSETGGGGGVHFAIPGQSYAKSAQFQT